MSFGLIFHWPHQPQRHWWGRIVGLPVGLISRNLSTTNHPIWKRFQSINDLEVYTPKVIAIAARIRWTEFHNLFTEWKRSGCRSTICISFSNISQYVAMATNCVKKWQTPQFRRSGIQKRNGITPCIMRDLIAPRMSVYRVKFRWRSVQ